MYNYRLSFWVIMESNCRVKKLTCKGGREGGRGGMMCAVCVRGAVFVCLFVFVWGRERENFLLFFSWHQPLCPNLRKIGSREEMNGWGVGGGVGRWERGRDGSGR